MKRVLMLLVVGTAVLDAQSPDVKRVHTVYVNELHFPGNPDLDGVGPLEADSLTQYCGSDCRVMEAIDGEGDIADAVLTGTVVVQTPDTRPYRVQGAMRLVDKDGAVLWAATVYNSPLARSATSSFADNVAKKLAAFLARK